MKLLAKIFYRNLIIIIMGIKWYLQYAWVKLNIWVLTPLVWVEQKWDQYTEWRFRKFVEYQLMLEKINYETKR